MLSATSSTPSSLAHQHGSDLSASHGHGHRHLHLGDGDLQLSQRERQQVAPRDPASTPLPIRKSEELLHWTQPVVDMGGGDKKPEENAVSEDGVSSAGLSSA